MKPPLIAQKSGNSGCKYALTSILGAALMFGVHFGFLSGVQSIKAAQVTPDFGTNVLVFDPSQKDMQARVYAVL